MWWGFTDLDQSNQIRTKNVNSVSWNTHWKTEMHRDSKGESKTSLADRE